MLTKREISQQLVAATKENLRLRNVINVYRNSSDLSFIERVGTLALEAVDDSERCLKKTTKENAVWAYNTVLTLADALTGRHLDLETKASKESEADSVSDRGNSPATSVPASPPSPIPSESEKDTERLDWWEKCGAKAQAFVDPTKRWVITHVELGAADLTKRDTFREALDAAMESEKEKKDLGEPGGTNTNDRT